MNHTSSLLGLVASAAFACALTCSVNGSATPDTPSQEDSKSREGTALTVYSSADPGGFDPRRFISDQRNGRMANYVWQVPGFGLVRETRQVDIPKGRGELRFTDVAAFIDPTTVSFRDLTSRNTQVLEQNFEFDLVSPEKLLEKYIDQEIVLNFRGVQWSGTLLSASEEHVVLKMLDGSVNIIPTEDASITMGALPGGLITRPTLVWKLNSPTGGKHLIQTTYETAGLTWRSDYNMVLGENDATADLTAWVSLMNLSGISYEDTQLKLVAGDVQRVQPKTMEMTTRIGAGAYGDAMRSPPAFQQESFFEYHLYTLPRRTDVQSNGTQQIALFNPIRGFPIQKELVFGPSSYYSTSSTPRTDENWGGAAPGKVAIFVNFTNVKEQGLGIPLPAGKVRVYKRNPRDGGIEFIGEDLIDHTPRNEPVRLKLGDAFDVVGERTRIDFTLNKDRKMMSETIRIEIRNQKETAQEVTILERMNRWKTWTLTKSSSEGTKTSADLMKWTVQVPAEGKKTIEYTVRYTW
ncbi:MAG: hypothetical protein CBC35_12380 [Planctomycetes bacterium TMED75]|nr:DUF4139 domain-containing protein [Planctomycetaceae bacterium]OUU90083.1 MAG: hypothetical protein CBC35_12380 [Planctomycetes bacterium TMED75]